MAHYPLIDRDFFASKAHPDGFKAWCAMSLALRDVTANELHPIDFETEHEDMLPRWPSTVDHMQVHAGGFYGMTVLLGAQKCGKTMLALGSCIEAAATQEWQVVYFSAELDEHEIALRLSRYFKSHPGALDCEHFFHVVHVGRGQRPHNLAEEVELATDPGGPPILVCMDSINTIAELSGDDYLKTLKDYALWAMISRRMSNGAASFLIVSETNQAGGAKGGKLEFWADVVLKLEKSGNVSTGLVPVKMNLLASRRTGGEGPMGTYLRNQNLCRFQTEDEAQGLRVVRGGRDWYDRDL